MRIRNKKLVIMVGLVAFGVYSTAPSPAFFSHNKQPKIPKPKPPDDEDTLKLVESIAHQPELMNIRYLRYALGPADNEAQNNPNAFIQHYYWHEPDGMRVKFELIQRKSPSGQIFQSIFTANTPHMKADLAHVESQYGEAQHKFFDQESHPNCEYMFAPDTKVVFKQPQNTFHISQSIITYSGDGLPALSALTLSQAQAAHRDQAFEHHRNKRWGKAIEPLQTRIAENPGDTEAHLALAQAYQHNNNLNGAINEYHIVLAQAKDPDTLDQCKQGMQQLKMLPPDGGDDSNVRKKIKITHHGQFLHEGDETGDKQNLPKVQQSYTLKPLDPPVALQPGADPFAGF